MVNLYFVFIPFQLKDEFGLDYYTKCDVEVLTHLYATQGVEGVCQQLDGVFAFCLLDVEKRKILVGRDPYGVRPLFKCTSSTGQFAVASECKVIMLFLYHF